LKPGGKISKHSKKEGSFRGFAMVTKGKTGPPWGKKEEKVIQKHKSKRGNNQTLKKKKKSQQKKRRRTEQAMIVEKQ